MRKKEDPPAVKPKPSPSATLGFDGSIKVDSNGNAYGLYPEYFWVTPDEARELASQLLQAAVRHEMLAPLLGHS